GVLCLTLHSHAVRHSICEHDLWQTVMLIRMFRWFSNAMKNAGPAYSLLRAVPSRGLPPELADREASSDFQERRNRIESDLASRPVDEDAAGFMTFLKAGNGLLQLRLKDLEGGCLLAFSTPLRAVDYASAATPERAFEYFS